MAHLQKEEFMADTHAAVRGSKRVPLPGARALGRTNPHTTIEVSLKLRPKNEIPDLTGRPAATMSREELAEKYGASGNDINKVVEAFQKFGLKRVEANAATRTVRLSGTIAQMENAFQVKLFDYAHPEGNYRGRIGEVSVPTDAKDIVQAVFGLDNRRVAKRRRHPVHELSKSKTLRIPSSWYSPSQLAAHYNFPGGDGTGQAVGLLEFGGGYFPADLHEFCKLAGVSVPTVVAVSTDGTATNSRDGAEGEVMLDVEVVAGICPKSTIVVYFAEWTEQGWITAMDAVIQDKAHDPGVISVSWGAPEDTDIWTDQAMTQMNEMFKEAALLGITICIAAGDDGSSDADMDGHAHADFPSSSPYVLAVGGTTIPTKGGSQPDIIWKEGDGLRSDSGGSTGGGVSAKFVRPPWQEGITISSVNPGAIVGRCVPDVAANADWNASPYLLVVDGKAQGNGGTSAATPLWAALVTLVNQARGADKRIGYLTPLLYQGGVGSAGCTDITSGDNVTATVGGYSAGPGYDAVSGWGTPNGKQLLAALPA
jgi:kumamolisin